jgi:hypothetical protein
MATARSQLRLANAGRTGKHFSGRNIVRYPGLRGQNHSVAQRAMPGHSSLPGQNRVSAHHRRAGQPSLRANQRVFRPRLSRARFGPDCRSFAPSAISVDPTVARSNAGVGLNIDTVSDAHRSRLRNLVPASPHGPWRTQIRPTHNRAIFERHTWSPSTQPSRTTAWACAKK